MIEDEEVFRNALRTVLLSDGGLMLESEGTIFIRSLEGPFIAAGYLDVNGGIVSEIEFETDVDSAIAYFNQERKRLNHGDMP